MTDPVTLPDGRLREAIEDYIAKAEKYRIHSELLFASSPIQITCDFIEARETLRALLASPLHAGADLWQAMDTAPEATWVLVFVPNNGINIATMTRDPNILGPNGAFWFIRGEQDCCWPTLWTPIPALSSSRTAPEGPRGKD